MTNDEVERAIEFLLQSQAKHDAQIGELREQSAANARQIAANTQQIAANTQQISANAQQIAANAQQIGETNGIVHLHAETQGEFIQIVTKALSDLANAQRRTDARIAEVEERNAHRYDALDARLDRLAAVVERMAEERGRE